MMGRTAEGGRTVCVRWVLGLVLLCASADVRAQDIGGIGIDPGPIEWPEIPPDWPPVPEPPPPAPPAPARTFKQVLAPVIDLLECDQPNATIQLLCRLVRARIDQELAPIVLHADRNGLLFSLDDPTVLKIDTGHGCSITAKVKRRRYSALLGADTDFDLRGNALSEPLLVMIELPLQLDARYDLRASFGARKPWPLHGCQEYASDSFWATGSLGTTAKLALVFTLGPSLSFDPNGNFVLKIHPLLKVAFELARLDVDLDVHGLSELTPGLIALVGGPSSISDALGRFFRGRSVSEAFNSQALITNFLAPIVLTGFTGPLEDPVLSLLGNLVEDRVQARAAGVGPDLEDRLMSQLRDLLDLDANGERVFVLRADFAQRVAAVGDAAAFLPSPPSWTGWAAGCSGPGGCSMPSTEWPFAAPISWAPVLGATHYELVRELDGVSQTVYSGSDTSYTETAEFFWGPVRYTLRACEGPDCGVPSPVFQWTAYFDLPPIPPGETPYTYIP